MLLTSQHAGGPIRLLGTQALRYASAAAAGTAAAVDISSSITLPSSGRTLDVAPGDVSFSMPAEWAPHSTCWIAWPRRHDVWRLQGRPAKQAFADVVAAVARFEPVTVVAHSEQVG